MKTILTSIAASSLLAALALAQPPQYTVSDLGTLVGGTYSQPYFINSNGLASGTASLADGTMHAVLSQRVLMMDIGLSGLGGTNSVAFAVNGKGQTVGQAETPAADPNGEDFCGFGTHLMCQPFLWQWGVMTPLPTLGGHNGVANQINSLGQVAGFAENATPDPSCPAPQLFHFEPVIWQNGKVQALPTVSGDPDGIASAVNDSGQVAGASGGCAAFNPDTLVPLAPRHALLWQNGAVTDLGNLGGTGQSGMGNLAFNLNNQGQVVGFSNLPGDATFHAFLWTQATGIEDLGTLPGDVASAAVGINDAGVVTGLSLDADFNPRAFLRQNGVMTDLNTLVRADSPLFLMQACSINSRGQIVGLAMRKSTGELHGFLATPTTGAAAGEDLSPAAQSANSPMVLPENVREQIRRRLPFGRFGGRLIGPR